jgi:putative methyltransferase (TIGR04325 family)
MFGRFSASKAARLLLPPIILRAAWFFGTPEWEYVADHWPRDDARSFGWDDSSVVQSMRQNWPAYKRAVDGTDPLAFWPWFSGGRDPQAHNVVMTWGYVLARAGSGKLQLSVLDWGGALGNYAAVGKALLPEVRLDFTVKERPALCTAGRELLPEVSFTSSEDECFSRRYDLVVASNALQYAQDWRATVQRLADAAEQWLFITCLPVVHNSGSFIVVQRPQRHGLKADYISWVLNCGDFLAHVRASGFALDRIFIAGGTTSYRNAPEASESLGFLFKKGFAAG